MKRFALIGAAGYVAPRHMKAIGMLKSAELDTHQQAFVDAKKQEFAAQENGEEDDYPPTAQLCRKCHHRAVVSLDNCLTCLHCGDSKCS